MRIAPPSQSLRLEPQICRGRGRAAHVWSPRDARLRQLDLLYAWRHRCRRPRGARAAPMGARAYRRARAHKHTPRTQTSVSSAPITSVVAILRRHLLSSARRRRRRARAPAVDDERRWRISTSERRSQPPLRSSGAHSARAARAKQEVARAREHSSAFTPSARSSPIAAACRQPPTPAFSSAVDSCGVHLPAFHDLRAAASTAAAVAQRRAGGLRAQRHSQHA